MLSYHLIRIIDDKKCTRVGKDRREANQCRHASVIFKAAAPSQCPFLELSISIDPTSW